MASSAATCNGDACKPMPLCLSQQRKMLVQVESNLTPAKQWFIDISDVMPVWVTFSTLFVVRYSCWCRHGQDPSRESIASPVTDRLFSYRAKSTRVETSAQLGERERERESSFAC